MHRSVNIGSNWKFDSYKKDQSHHERPAERSSPYLCLAHQPIIITNPRYPIINDFAVRFNATILNKLIPIP